MKKSTFLFILTLISFFLINAEAQERGKDIPLSPEDKRAVIYGKDIPLSPEDKRAVIYGKDIPLSPEDKRTMIALLKGADARFYRFQSANGREVYGSRKISTTESNRIKVLGAPDTRGIIVNFKETRSIIVHYKDGTIIAATSPTSKTDPDVFVNLLGKQGADKLRDILSKYFVHDVDN